MTPQTLRHRPPRLLRPTRAEYHVPGLGLIVHTSRQWPPWIAFNEIGVRVGARRTAEEAMGLLRGEEP